MPWVTTEYYRPIAWGLLLEDRLKISTSDEAEERLFKKHSFRSQVKGLNAKDEAESRVRWGGDPSFTIRAWRKNGTGLPPEKKEEEKKKKRRRRKSSYLCLR